MVIRTYAPDPYRPQVRIIIDRHGDKLDRPIDLNLWEAMEEQQARVEAPLDPADYQIDPLTYL